MKKQRGRIYAWLLGFSVLSANVLAAPLGKLDIEFELPKLDVGMYARPYVAIWIEDAQGQPVRTVALWQKEDTWLKDIRRWWRQVGRYDRALIDAVTSATRPAGQYRLQWDGLDDEGQPLVQGEYLFYAEVVREHGGRDVVRQAMTLQAQPKQYQLEATYETGVIRLRYQP